MTVATVGRILSLAVLMGAASLSAMPTAEELAEVKPLVAELIKPDMDAMRAGKKSKSDAAKASLSLASQAETPAAKLLLTRNAFQLCMKGGDYDAADAALDAMLAAVPDYPADELQELLEKALYPVPSKKAPQIRARVAALKQKAAAATQLKKVLALLEKTPDDPALNLRLGTVYALQNDWKRALPALAKSNSPLAKPAARELEAIKQSNNTKNQTIPAAALADAWWSVELPKKDAQLQSALRAHAADLYKISLPDLTGLTKVQAERRIKEVESANDAESVVAPKASYGKRPYDVELEYLESDGRTYVDTGIIPDNSTGYYIRYYPVRISDSVVFGMRQDSGNSRFYCGINGSGEYVGIGPLLSVPRIPAGNEWYEVSVNFKGDKKLIKSSSKTPSATYNLDYDLEKKTFPCWIFAPNVAGQIPGYIGTFRVSDVKISKAGKVIFDAVPVRVGKIGYMR